MQLIINPKKKLFSDILRFSGIEKLLFAGTYLRYGANFIRAVNYHSTPPDSYETFERQFRFFQEHYSSVAMEDLKRFFATGRWNKPRPGLIISFDDGIYNNYSVAGSLLKKYGFVGWFFVSPDFCDTPVGEQVGFAGANRIFETEPLENGRVAMTWDELRDLSKNHVIGSHTRSHCRFCGNLSSEKMASEIIESKRILEDRLSCETESFCWVGGESDSYNREAMRLILKGGYQFGFTTIPMVITSGTNKFLLGRSNIESDWPVDIIKFQLSGAMDILYLRKRRKVHGILRKGLKS